MSISIICSLAVKKKAYIKFMYTYKYIYFCTFFLFGEIIIIRMTEGGVMMIYKPNVLALDGNMWR